MIKERHILSLTLLLLLLLPLSSLHSQNIQFKYRNDTVIFVKYTNNKIILKGANYEGEFLQLKVNNTTVIEKPEKETYIYDCINDKDYKPEETITFNPKSKVLVLIYPKTEETYYCNLKNINSMSEFPESLKAGKVGEVEILKII